MNRVTTVIIIALVFTAGCASRETRTSSGSGENELVPERRIAWMEGDLQNDYEPNRTVAAEKAAELESKVPEMKDVSSYLNYLSTLDAASDSPSKGGEVERKIKAFLVSRPTEKRTVFLLAVHYMRRGKRELAAHFFKTLEKDPSFPWKSLLFNNLGMMALKDKDRAGAMAYFEKAVNSQPPTAAPYVNLGALYLESRSYSDALPLFTKAVQIDSDFEDAALGLGVSMEGMGKFEAAHTIYANFISDHPESLSVLYNNAIVLGNRLKQREEAAQVMLSYIQRGGKETAKAHEIIQSWR